VATNPGATRCTAPTPTLFGSVVNRVPPEARLKLRVTLGRAKHCLHPRHPGRLPVMAKLLLTM
jgi:hypothetical protein